MAFASPSFFLRLAALSALVMTQTGLRVLGYQAQLSFRMPWHSLAEAYFLLGNWHLLFYGAIAVALLGWRHLLARDLAPLTITVAGGFAFLAFGFGFTNAGVWVEDQSTVNRATLHLAPLLVLWMIMTFRAWAEAHAVAVGDRQPGMTDLPDITLACVDTVNHALALRALDRSRRGMRFARAVLLTDRVPAGSIPDGIEVANIGPLPSRDAYSHFVLKRLLPHVATKHVLLVQWDGYVVNPAAWEPAFLDMRLHRRALVLAAGRFRVGNGGFSLRSRKLLEALQDPRIVLKDAEDLTIGHAFRTLLESEFSIRFADETLAERFAFEAAHPIGRPFGFHGLFNFARVVDDAELAALAPTVLRRDREIAANGAARSQRDGCGQVGRSDGAGTASAYGAARRRRRRDAARASARRRCVGTRSGTQRSVSLRQRQAVQALPRRSRSVDADGHNVGASGRSARATRIRCASARRSRRRRAGLSCITSDGCRPAARLALSRRDRISAR